MAGWLRTIVAVLLVACASGAAFAEPTSALRCEPRIVAEAGYVVCTIDPKIARPRLFWKGTDGEPYRTFAGVAEATKATGKSLVFAMNAGMYADDFSPMGLYVEDGEELRPANTFEVKPSAGVVPNFYKQPNGVFFLTEKEA